MQVFTHEKIVMSFELFYYFCLLPPWRGNVMYH